MTFTEALLSANYVLDEQNFDLGCYVKMTEDFDVITEVTFNPDKQTVAL